MIMIPFFGLGLRLTVIGLLLVSASVSRNTGLGLVRFGLKSIKFNDF